MKQTKINYNIAGLDELRNAVGGTYITRVGILGAKDARGGTMGNADIGVIHEFGSETNDIPPRSFLRMPLETKRKELMKGMSGSVVKEAFKAKDYKRVFQQLGVVGEQIVQSAFSSGGFGQWPALKPSTIDAKGSAAPLIDTAQLRRSITSDVVKKGEVN